MKNRCRNKARRDERVKEAGERQATYKGLTTAQKLASLDAGGHAAQQQRARLAKPPASTEAKLRAGPGRKLTQAEIDDLVEKVKAEVGKLVAADFVKARKASRKAV